MMGIHTVYLVVVFCLCLILGCLTTWLYMGWKHRQYVTWRDKEYRWETYQEFDDHGGVWTIRKLKKK